MGFRAWVKDKAKKAKRELEKAEREVQKLADKAKREAEKAALAVEKEARRVAKEAERLAEQLEQQLLKEAKQMVQKIFNDAKRDIQQFAESAVKDTRDAFTKELPKLAEKAFDETREAFEKELPALLQKALAELEQAITREGLKKIRDGIRSADREVEALRKRKPGLANALDIPGGSITLGPMTLKYSGFFTRTAKLADSLDHYVNDPPRFRRGPLLQLIEALGPDSVDLGIDISAALVVVQSDTLSVGFAVDELPMEVFIEIADAIMEALGVPE